jgi:hypothetical protein
MEVDLNRNMRQGKIRQGALVLAMHATGFALATGTEGGDTVLKVKSQLYASLVGWSRARQGF